MNLLLFLLDPDAMDNERAVGPALDLFWDLGFIQVMQISTGLELKNHLTMAALMWEELRGKFKHTFLKIIKL